MRVGGNYDTNPQTMNKRLKYGLLIFGLGTILIVGLVSFGLYSMEIEDHYGELEDFFYKSKSGDVIINRKASKFGIIEKNWKRVSVKTKDNSPTDLYNWIRLNGLEHSNEIYRTKNNKTDLKNITYPELVQLIESSELKLITGN